MLLQAGTVTTTTTTTVTKKKRGGEAWIAGKSSKNPSKIQRAAVSLKKRMQMKKPAAAKKHPKLVKSKAMKRKVPKVAAKPVEVRLCGLAQTATRCNHSCQSNSAVKGRSLTYQGLCLPSALMSAG